MDLIIRTTGTLDLTAAAVTSASDLTPLNPPDDLPQLVLGTTEPITVKFVSAASTFEAWSDDPTYTVYASLGVVTSRGTDILSESVLSTVISDGKGGDLPINTEALASYVFGAFAENRRANTVQLTLQITVADSNGDRRAYAMLPVTVWGRVASFDAARASIPSADVVTRTEVLSALSDSQTAANAAAASAAAALVSQNAAAASESDAEAAEIDAEAAAVSANASKLAAAASASAALASQGTAASSESVAIVQAAAASASASAASGSASAAASSASSAASSASSASTSATTALNAIISTFKGGVAGGSVPATSTAAGDYYRITSAGTSQSKTWATGDLAIYNGTSGSWTQVSGGVTDPASLAAWANTKTPRGGIAFDGTTGQRATSTLTGQTIGTDPVSVVMTFRVPTTLATQGLWFLASSATLNNQARCLFAELRSTGHLYVTLIGATTGDVRTAQVASFFTTYGGKVITLAVTKSASGLTIYVDGTVLSQGAETTVGTPPAWSDTVTGTYLTWGTNSTGGTEHLTASVYGITLYNLALSAADVLEIAETGGAVPYRFQFGSQTNLVSNVSRNSDFSAGATDWTASGNASVAVVSNALNVSTTGGGYGYVDLTDSFFGGGAWTVGKAFEFKADVSNFAITSFTGIDSATGNILWGPVTAGGTFRAVWTRSANKYIRIDHSGAGSYTLDNVTLKQVGAVVHFALDEGIGYQLHDASTNKLDAVMTTTGVSHLVPRREGYVRTPGTGISWSASHEPKNILGAASTQRMLPNAAVITQIVLKASGASTNGASVNSTNTAARWSAVAALSTTKSVRTVANSGLPAGTADADTDILVDPDTVNYTGTIQADVRYCVAEG